MTSTKQTCSIYWCTITAGETAATTFNGDHLVFRGQLELSVALVLTAGVSGFIASAEFRVAATAKVVLDAAFTRVNKCWASESGDVVRKGVSDGFAMVVTATVVLSLRYVINASLQGVLWLGCRNAVAH